MKKELILEINEMKYLDKKEWTKESFLNYCLTHSQTDRALFSRKMIAELEFMRGNKEKAEEFANSIISFYSVDLTNVVIEILNRNSMKKV